MRLTTLTKRAEFLRLRGGARWGTPAFLLETRPRVDPPDNPTGPARFGFTVTKAMGGAVERNRMKRRLREAVRAVSACARAGQDYVLIARRAALDRPFEELKKDLEQAFQRVHHPPAPRRAAKRQAS